MTNGAQVELDAAIERKAPALPRYAVVPAPAIARLGLEGTTVIEGTLAGVDLGRQTIKRWDDERWFVSVTEAICRKAGVDTGDRVRLVFRVAPETMPPELEELLRTDPAAAARWRAMTDSQRRMLREDILARKSPAARARCAAKGAGRGRVAG